MILIILQIIVAILLVMVILLQTPGSGLSSTFGGGSFLYRSKRSLEKFLVVLTILLSAIFVILSVLLLAP